MGFLEAAKGESIAPSILTREAAVASASRRCYTDTISYPRPSTSDPRDIFDRPFRVVFWSIAIIETTIWLAIFEHNYHPRIYSYSSEVTILQAGDSELDFNRPPRAFSI